MSESWVRLWSGATTDPKWQTIARVNHGSDRTANRRPGNRIVNNAIRVHRHIQRQKVATFLYINFGNFLLAIRKIGVSLTQ